MLKEEALLELLADARLYLAAGELQATMDILEEGFDGFSAAPRLGQEAVDLANRAFLAFTDRHQQEEARSAVDAVFRLGCRLDPQLAALEAAFMERYRLGLLVSETSATPLHRAIRHHQLLSLFERTHDLDGAVAECGCARGLSFLQLCHATRERQAGWRGEGFAVFDSFEGLSEPVTQDLDTSDLDPAQAQRILSMTYAGNMACRLETVSAAVWREFPQVEFRKGWLPAALADVPQRAYRFVHVDVDLYEPTRGCFEFFYPQLVPGGIIVTDDYNWPGGRRAVDEFCAAAGLVPRLTATHQAYLVAP